MVTDKKMEDALEFLSSTDCLSAEAKTDVARKEFLAKRVRARQFLLAEGNIEARKATAETSQEASEADEAWATAILAYEKLRARRTTAELLVEVWRTTSANRRQGQI